MLRGHLPSAVSKVLWGDRRRFGLVPDQADPEWLAWQKKAYSDFYQATQQRGIGNLVNGMAYPVVSRVVFKGKRVLGIGPGIIRHLGYMTDKPDEYTVCDINEDVLGMAAGQLKRSAIPGRTVLLRAGDPGNLPFDSASYDIIISFNSLEHLYPLEKYLDEFCRILRRDGRIAGGIPCEGGLAWGLGRLITARRYVQKNYKIDYDKIICWEHPNFADMIIRELDGHFIRQHLRLHPFALLGMDLNLIASFIYAKK
jgi:SAM-dependent methyltransferase